MSLFTSVELLIMGSILGGLLLIIFVLVISELISRKKDKILQEFAGIPYSQCIFSGY